MLDGVADSLPWGSACASTQALASTHRGHRPASSSSSLVVWIRRAGAPTRQTRNERQLLKMLRAVLPETAELKIFSDVPKTPPLPDAIALFSRAKVCP